MHAGRLDTTSKAAVVFRRLADRPGRWHSGWMLTTDCQSSAIATRVSEIRRQLEDDPVWDIESKREGTHWSYRVVRRPRSIPVGQMSLGV